MKVAIIGGGWAGLAAAVELSAAGVAVSVFEAARQLGGRARRVEIDGHLLDNGQHILLGAYRETLRLMRTVGANPQALLKRQPLELDYPGAGFRMQLPRLPAPLHLALGLLAAKGCRYGEKFAAVRFMRFLQSNNFDLVTDCSVSELLDRHGQHGNLRRYLWQPLCLAALNTAPHNASAQIFANVLRDSLGGSRAETDALLPTADLSRLFPDAAAEFIRAHGGQIHLSARVEQIDPRLPIQSETFDQVILAAAPQHAAHLLATLPETATVSALLNSYAYEPIATAYVAYPPDVRLPCTMLGLDGDTRGGLGQWVFDRGALCATPGVMGFVLSANGQWDEYDSDALVAALHGELEETLRKPLPQPLWHHVICERRATFSCRPDLPRPPAQTPLPGLWLAGDYVCASYPATLEGAVRSGVTAAKGILGS